MDKDLIKTLTQIDSLIEKLDQLIDQLDKKREKLERKINLMKIISIDYDKDFRCKTFTISNIENLNNSKDILLGIYNVLMAEEEFLSFGTNKVIMTIGVFHGSQFAYHQNVYLNNETPFIKYYNATIDHLNKLYEHGYEINNIDNFIVRVWNMDNLANQKIKLTKNLVDNTFTLKEIDSDTKVKPINYKTIPIPYKVKTGLANFKWHNNKKIFFKGIRKYSNLVANIEEVSLISLAKNMKELPEQKNKFLSNITPLPNTDKYKANFGVLDIETISNGIEQIPVAISLCFKNENGKFISKVLVNLSHVHEEDLFKDVINYILDNRNYFNTIFVHNLGSFDGLFIYKNLLNIIDPTLISKELGDMKDELEGLTIKRAYFLGIKKYGYQIINNEGVLEDKSTFAGVKRNSLTFEEIESIYNGAILIKEIPIRFYKDLKKLSINIMSTYVTIKFQPDKKLENNNYIPILNKINKK